MSSLANVAYSRQGCWTAFFDLTSYDALRACALAVCSLRIEAEHDRQLASLGATKSDPNLSAAPTARLEGLQVAEAAASARAAMLASCVPPVPVPPTS